MTDQRAASADHAPRAATPSWRAPRASSAVRATCALPGSKSQTNRALLLSALSDGITRITAPLRSRDTLLMAAALRALGVAIDDDGECWVVRGGLDATGHVSIDVGNAGTVARFLPAVAALGSATVTLDGDPRIRERPVGPLVTALRAVGADVDGDALPLTVRGHGSVRGGDVAVDATQSSQLVSGLLLAAPRFTDGVVVRHTGRRVPSAPHLAMTVAMMRERGADVDDTAPAVWRVQPGRYAAVDVDVEPDLSGASAFLGAAAATGGQVTVPGWPATTTQPGAQLPALLEQMGCAFRLDESGMTVTGPPRLVGLTADLGDVPELTPVLAVLAALATTPSRLTGVAHLRVQETDRIAALATELGRLGGDVDELSDGLVIRPAPLHGGTWQCYDDHRLAMAGALVGLVVDGVELDDVATTGKTMPDFVDRWTAMLG